MKRGNIKHKLHLFLEVTEVIQSKSPAIVKKNKTQNKTRKNKQILHFPLQSSFIMNMVNIQKIGMKQHEKNIKLTEDSDFILFKLSGGCCGVLCYQHSAHLVRFLSVSI